MKKIIVDGKTFVEETRQKGERKRIVVVDNRGLTFVGWFAIPQCGDQFVSIRDARCIIRWGTTKHLAELVDGPTESTRFGATSDVVVQAKNIVAIYDCGDGWLPQSIGGLNANRRTD